LSNLASTLGPTFFSDDILNPTPSPGELSGSTKPSRTVDDAGSSIEEEAMLRDVTPERFNRIEKELVRGKNEINRRLVALSVLFEQVAWLYTELGIPLPLPGEPTPSAQEFPYPRPFRSSAAGRQDPFVVVPAPDPERQRREYFPLFATFVSKLQEAEEGREVGSIEGVDPTSVLMEWFERLKTDVS
jgi:protein regulator of cytokinesis 1